MKEYLLLLFIALVGLSGLFSIHHEVKANQIDNLPYFEGNSFSKMPVVLMESTKEISQMVIDKECGWPEIGLEVTNFDKQAIYLLDTGIGKKRKLTSPVFVIKYAQSGIYLVKLIKDNILIDAVELIIKVNEPATGKMVSY